MHVSSSWKLSGWIRIRRMSSHRRRRPMPRGAVNMTAEEESAMATSVLKRVGNAQIEDGQQFRGPH